MAPAVTGLVDGLVGLVTGAGSGIGAASARLFAAEGARVAVADLDGDAAAAVADEITAAGGEAIALAVDVADESAVAAMVATVIDRFGRLDCAHNNAGISSPPFATIDITLEEWNRMLSVNLTGVFLCVREELKVMVPRRTWSVQPSTALTPPKLRVRLRVSSSTSPVPSAGAGAAATALSDTLPRFRLPMHTAS